MGREFQWTIEHRQRGPTEHNDLLVADREPL